MAVVQAPTRRASRNGSGNGNGAVSRSGNGAAPAAPADAVPTLRRLPFAWLALVSAALMALCFRQEPGRLLADTKLDLVIDPGGFLERALHLWDPSTSFGQIQNQAAGYLFPMGPFFWLGNELGVPMWMVQRVWIGLLLVIALWGVAALARKFGIGSPVHWVVAGSAYALSPFFLAQLASTSAALIPAALVPWALLALVYGSRGGSERRAAALSGLAIAAMGGVNAASTLAVLPLPALWLITRRSTSRLRVLTGWWIVAVGLAIGWWLAPLLLQDQWGFDFVRYTETTQTTELATSAFEAVRGAGHWLAYLNLGGPWLPAGWELVSTAVIVLASAAVAAAGLAGLARARVPERGFLIASVLVGAVLVCSGYLGSAGGLLDGPLRSALDGPLAAFRNVQKFEPVLRLPLALGLAAALAAVPRRRLLAPMATAVAVAAIAIAALPLLDGGLAQRGSFERVPQYWQNAARFLDRNAGRSTSLLVPAAPFAEYTWGRTLDEPLQPLGRSPWVSRSLIPLGGAASTAMLDAIERRLHNGVSSPGLEAALARAGIRYVVVRNDLDWRRAGAPRPVEVHNALIDSGLRRVASFGPQIGRPVPRRQASGSLISELGIGRFESRLPQIEIFAGGPAVRTATALPADRTVTISGGPQSLPDLTDQRMVTSRDPTVTVADPAAPGRGRRWAVTDSLRRADTDLGLVHDKDSYTLEAGERAAGALGPPRQLLGGGSTVGHEAVARLGGQISAVSASSYGSWLLNLPFVEPASAFDGDRSTAWVSGGDNGSLGQWVQADLERAVRPSAVRVRLLEDGPWRPLVTRLRVTTAAGSTTSAVQPDQSLQTIAAPSGPTSWVRVGFEGVRNERPGAATSGLREVQVLVAPPGDRPSPIPRATRWVRVPQERSELTAAARRAGPSPAFALSRLSSSPRDVLRRDQEPVLRRIFTVPRRARLQLQATALPVRGRALDRLLTPIGAIDVSTTSSWLSLPEYRAANLIDGSKRTDWVAAPSTPPPARLPGAPGLRGFGEASSPRFASVSPAPAETDADPAIRLRWDGRRSLSRLRIEPALGFTASPQRIVISSPQGRRTLEVPPSGVMRFKALRTDRVEVSFPRVDARFTTTGLPLEPRTRLPVGLAELDFPGLRDLRLQTLAPNTPITRPCGEGPPIVVDGRRLPTAINAVAGELVQLQSLPVQLCRADSSLSLAAGKHRLSGGARGPFALSSVSLRPRDWAAQAEGAPRRTRIGDWDDSQRTVEVGAGPRAYLAIRENFNDGWEATLRDRELEPIRLDGWQQGFALPPGRGGTVDLRFAPQSTYSTALWIGGGLALALVLMIAIPAWRRAARPSAPSRVAAGSLVLVGLGTVAVALVSLPAAPAVPLAALVARRWPGALAWAAGAALAVAGVLVAIDLNPEPLQGAGAFGIPAQLLASIGLACLAGSLLSRPRSPR